MNRPQKLVLLAFILSVLMAGLFPPWKFEERGLQRRAGFHLLFSAPQLRITEKQTDDPFLNYLKTRHPYETDPAVMPKPATNPFLDYLKTQKPYVDEEPAKAPPKASEPRTPQQEQVQTGQEPNRFLEYLKTAKPYGDEAPATPKTTVVEIGRLEGRIDTVQLTVEWVTLVLVSSALLLVLRKPRAS